jgi:molecular chaperone DnaJ
MPVTDPYATLGVPRTATADEIKSAYRKLARQYHPDVNPNNAAAEEKFKEVSEAYAILSDAEKKERFDRFGVTDDQGMGGPGGGYAGGGFVDGGFGDIFEAFFGQGGQQRGRRGLAEDGDDLRTEADLNLGQVLTGGDVEVRYRRRVVCGSCTGFGTADGSAPVTCPQCDGTGQVTTVRQTFLGSVRTSSPCPKCRGAGYLIENPCRACSGKGSVTAENTVTVTVPPGVESGQRLRVANKGSEGLRGGRNGDLYVDLIVQDDPRFLREGTNLLTEVEVTYAQAVIGDAVEFEGLSGSLEIDIPPGTQPGETFKVKGEGLPRLHGGNRGDLYVRAKLVVPKKVSEGEAALLREYAELRGEPIPQGKSEGFLGGLFGKGKKKR